MEAPLTLAPPSETRRRMSYEEFLHWADEDTRAEWVDGEVILFMPPKPIHQITLDFLQELLSLFVRLFALGRVHSAPFEMRAVPGGSSREPDLFFVATPHLSRITDERLEGPADLIIEVVSTESVRRDRRDKLREYAAAGIPEYWVVDPRFGKHRADFWGLNAQGQYERFATEEDEWVESRVLPGFRLRPVWLWQAGQLNPLTCLLEVEGVAEAFARQIEAAQRRASGTE